MKDFVLLESVASKLAQTFVDSEVMHTAIKKFIRIRVEDDITDAVERGTQKCSPKRCKLTAKRQ